MTSQTVTGQANFSESTTVHHYVVPAGKRWKLVGGHLVRHNSATVGADIYSAANKVIQRLTYKGAATTSTVLINSTDYPTHIDGFWMEAGEYIKITFGAAAGANAEISIVYKEEAL